MSIHIEATPGDIATTILLPGDPLRAKYIAENRFKDYKCYNQVRGMLGFTGQYASQQVSVQGTGMGIPSISIYAEELIREFGVKKLIRVGTCGTFQKDVALGDVLIAQGASTDSAVNRLRFNGMDFAPLASFNLLQKAHDFCEDNHIPVRIGNVLTSDTFYNDNPKYWQRWAEYGVLAAEMETAALYTIAAKHGVGALSILTVSDNLVSGEQVSAEERQKKFMQMVDIALAL